MKEIKQIERSVELLLTLATNRKPLKVNKYRATTYGAVREYIAVGTCALGHMEKSYVKKHKWFPTMEAREVEVVVNNELPFYTPLTGMGELRAFYNMPDLLNLEMLVEFKGFTNVSKEALETKYEVMREKVTKSGLVDVIHLKLPPWSRNILVVENTATVLTQTVFMEGSTVFINTVRMCKDFGLRDKDLIRKLHDVLLEEPRFISNCRVKFYPTTVDDYVVFYELGEELYLKLLNSMPMPSDMLRTYKRVEGTNIYGLFKTLKEDFNTKHPNLLKHHDTVYGRWYDDYAFSLREMFTCYGVEPVYHSIHIRSITMKIYEMFDVHTKDYALRIKETKDIDVHTIDTCSLEVKLQVAEYSKRVMGLSEYMLDNVSDISGIKGELLDVIHGYIINLYIDPSYEDTLRQYLHKS